MQVKDKSGHSSKNSKRYHSVSQSVISSTDVLSHLHCFPFLAGASHHLCHNDGSVLNVVHQWSLQPAKCAMLHPSHARQDSLSLRASVLAKGPTVNLIRAMLMAEGSPPNQTASQAKKPVAVEVTS